MNLDNIYGINIKAGNHKLGIDTAIINMGAAIDCPSKRKKLCQLSDNVKCYALKAEKLYPSVINYRRKQAKYWLQNTTSNILSDIYEFIKRKTYPIKYLRFNESGDFYNQKDVDKLSQIAISLNYRGIITYGYTARSDLYYNKIHFLLKGSGFFAPNGKTTVIKKVEDLPDNFYLCGNDCRVCTLCKDKNNINIAFKYH